MSLNFSYLGGYDGNLLFLSNSNINSFLESFEIEASFKLHAKLISITLLGQTID